MFQPKHILWESMKITYLPWFGWTPKNSHEKDFHVLVGSHKIHQITNAAKPINIARQSSMNNPK